MKKLIIIALSLIVLMMFVFFIFNILDNSFEFTLSSPDIHTSQSFEFLVVSDLHYLSDSVHDNSDAFKQYLKQSDKLVQYSNDIMNAVVLNISANIPDFIVFSGDLTSNGDLQSHEELADKFDLIEKMGTNVFVIPGNHDILNPMARQFFGKTVWETDYITKDMFERIYGNFGYNEAVSRDSNSLSYLAMPTEDNWLLMLDTASYNNNIKEGQPEQSGSLSQKTMGWIKKCSALAKENNADLIAVMHHSLLNHSDLINQNYTINNSVEISKLLIDCDVKLTLSGHIHLQDIKSCSIGDKTINDISTSCLGVYPNQYGKVYYKPGEGYYYETIKLNMIQYALNIDADNLLNFDQESIDFFVRQCCNRQNQSLSQIKGLSEVDLKKIRDTVSKMNLMYFAGYRNEELDDLVNTEGYKILMELEPCFIHDYINHMLNDERSDNNKLFVPENDDK